MKDNVLTIHTDGGARGNPGPAACAFIAESGKEILSEGSLYLGNSTNNFAEYQGVLLALRWLIKNKEATDFDKVFFCLDSELVVRQINGVYKVKDTTLKKLFSDILDLISSSKSEISFRHVPRIQNKLADILVNNELDKQMV